MIDGGSNARLELFGDFRLVVDGAEHQPAAPAKRLLAWLALEEGVQRRARVLAELWPDLERSRASSRLSQAIWTLRRDGLERLVVTERHGKAIRLAPSLTLDVRLFGRLLDDHAEGRQRVADLRTACRLSSRPLLERWDEQWIMPARHRFEQMFVAACRQLVDVLGARDDEAALEVAQAWINRRPLDEDGYRECLRVLDRLQRRTEAIGLYRQLVRLFQNELGCEPSADLAAAHRRREDAGQSRLENRDRDMQQTPVVGRGRERADILRLGDLALDGHGSLVIIEGAAGIGKSRLLEQLSSDLRWRGTTVATAVATQNPSPFAPMIEALSGRISPAEARLLEDVLEQPWLAEATRLLPGLQWSTRYDEGNASLALDPDRQRTVLVHTIRAMAMVRPFCLVIDDLHLADLQTIESLAVLADDISTVGCLLLVGLRSGEEMPPERLRAIHRLDGSPASNRFKLEPLDVRAVYQLARRLDDRLTMSHAVRIHELSDGNPLLALHLIEATDIGCHDFGSPKIAPNVVDPIQKKVDELEGVHADLIGVLAVHGFGLTMSCLAAVLTDHRATELAEGLLDLSAMSLVREVRGAYALSHERIRNAADNRLDEAKRSLIARSLLAQLGPGSDEPTIEARLAAEAGDWGRAARAYLLAGQRERSRGSCAAALEHFRAADHAATKADLTDEHVRLLLAIHDTCSTVGDLDGCRVALSRLGSIRVRGHWPDVALREGWFAHKNGDSVAARQHAEQVLDETVRVVPPDGTVHRLMAEVMLDSGEFRIAVRMLRAALTENPSPRETAEIRVALGRAQLELSEGDLGRAQFQRAMAIFEAEGAIEGLIDATRSVAVVRIHGGETEAGFAMLEEAIGEARRIGDRKREARCLLSLGLAYAVLQDNLGRGTPILERALELTRLYGVNHETAMILNSLAASKGLILRQFELAIDHALEAIQISQDAGLRATEALCRFTLAELEHLSGDHDSAVVELRRSLELFAQAGDPQPSELAHAEMATLLAELGEHDKAGWYINRALAMAESHSHPEDLSSIYRRRAKVRLAAGRLDEAADDALQSVALISPGTDGRHWVMWDCAVVLREAGRDPQADLHTWMAYERLLHVVDECGPALRDVARSSGQVIEAAWKRLEGTVHFVELPSNTGPASTVVAAWPSYTPPAQPEGGDTGYRTAYVERVSHLSRDQGARLTADALADVLGVSRRTAKRYLHSATSNP